MREDLMQERGWSAKIRDGRSRSRDQKGTRSKLI